jgi:hypothetical protein
LSYVRGLREKDAKKIGALALGTRIHSALEGYYKSNLDGDPKSLLGIYANLIEADRLELLIAGHSPDELDKEAELGRLMLEDYLEWVRLEGLDANLDILGVEHTLEHEIIPGKVTLSGKIDMLALDNMNAIPLMIDFKPQPKTEKVLTPSGYVSMGSLKVGDSVLGSDYIPTTVTGVYEKGVHDVYLVTFKDGATVRSTADHPWVVFDRVAGRTRVVETLELTKNRTSLVVPIAPADGADADLPVNPYVLGQWIGGGSRVYGDYQGEAHITCPDQRVVDTILGLVSGSTVRSVPPRKEGHVEQFTVSIPCQDELLALGVGDKHSYDRMVPGIYLYSASREQRLQLLRGLMDSNGSTQTHSFSTYYGTTSKELADNICTLVRSLGGNAWIGHERIGKHQTESGDYVETRPYYLVRIRMLENPFLVGGNHDAWEAHAKKSLDKKRMYDSGEISWAASGWSRSVLNESTYYRKVVSVVPDGQEDCRCIRVDAPDSLYITSGEAVTHNTAASFSTLLTTAHMSPQLMTYVMLYMLNEPTIPDAALAGSYRILKKSKRTARAAPPFHLEHTVGYNRTQLSNHREHTSSKAFQIMQDREALESGRDHHTICPPTVTSICSWMCPFMKICPMFDDGSAVDDMIDEIYVETDPYAYRASDTIIDI